MRIPKTPKQPIYYRKRIKSISDIGTKDEAKKKKGFGCGLWSTLE